MLRPTVGKFAILSRPIVVSAPPLPEVSVVLRKELTVTFPRLFTLEASAKSTFKTSPKLR